ncbi:MAG: glycosyltransferase family 4 protein, partial [Flavobacteriales bacterium]
DTVNHHNKVKEYTSGKLVIGWTGTHSTIKYLEELVSLLAELEKEHDFELLVVADQKPSFELQSLRFVPWSKASEIDDLLKMDVGIMPLKNDKWANGKCGFKALQYMALGIPAIVSPVGVNTEIVDHGKNGWICNSEQEWRETFLQILADKSQLQNYSKAARAKIESRYSVKSNTANFLHLFAND